MFLVAMNKKLKNYTKVKREERKVKRLVAGLTLGLVAGLLMMFGLARGEPEEISASSAELKAAVKNGAKLYVDGRLEGVNDIEYGWYNVAKGKGTVLATRKDPDKVKMKGGHAGAEAAVKNHYRVYFDGKLVDGNNVHFNFYYTTIDKKRKMVLITKKVLKKMIYRNPKMPQIERGIAKGYKVYVDGTRVGPWSVNYNVHDAVVDDGGKRIKLTKRDFVKVPKQPNVDYYLGIALGQKYKVYFDGWQVMPKTINFDFYHVKIDRAGKLILITKKLPFDQIGPENVAVLGGYTGASFLKGKKTYFDGRLVMKTGVDYGMCEVKKGSSKTLVTRKLPVIPDEPTPSPTKKAKK